MTSAQPLCSNFAHLGEHDDQLLRLGLLAERYFPEDPNTSLIKLRQLAELLGQMTAAKVGLYESAAETQFDLLRRLRDRGLVPREIAQLFDQIRRSGNAAAHSLEGDHKGALAALKIAWQLSVWFHRTFKNAAFKSGPFVPPVPPRDQAQDLSAELDRLSLALAEHQTEHREAVGRLQSVEAQLSAATDEKAFWEQMATEAELGRAALEQRLQDRQAQASAEPAGTIDQVVRAANQAAAAVQLDEAETRKLIDEQLRQAGWMADSERIR